MKNNGKHETSPSGLRAAKQGEKIAAAFAGLESPEHSPAYLAAVCSDEYCGLCRTPQAMRRPGMHHAGLTVWNRPEPSTARVQALRERRAGLKRVEVYAHPEDAERIKRYAAKLARKRTKEQP